MVNHKHKISWQMLIISIMSVILLICGVYAGFHHNWIGMGLSFFSSVYMAGFGVFLLFNSKVDSCFTRLKELISGESDPIQLGKSNKLVRTFYSVTSVVLFILMCLSCDHQYWLMMSLLLSAFAIFFLISLYVMISLKIQDYSKYLEQLISNCKECNSSKEQPGE